MEPPYPSFAGAFNVPQKNDVLVFDVRRAAVSLPFQVRHLQVLVEAGLNAFPNECFEFADEGPEEAQHCSLASLPRVFASHLHSLSKVAVVVVCAKVPPRLLFLLPCYVHLSLHTRTHAPTMCSARALRALCQFGRRGKHGVDHVGRVITDAHAIGDWW